MTYLAIDHLGIATEDLQEATRIYRDVLGFPVEGSESLPERGLEVTFVNAGNARIELLGATRDDSEISGFLSKRGPGIHHICIKVPDIDAAVAQLETRGARLAGNGIQTGAHNTRVAFIHPKSASGVLIELVEDTTNEKSTP